MSDPVKILLLAQVVCDNCGWHTSPVETQQLDGGATAREWARLHRVAGCPLKKPRLMLSDLPGGNESGDDR